MKKYSDVNLNEQLYKKIGPDQTGMNLQYNVPNYSDDKQIILNVTSGKVDSKNNNIIRFMKTERNRRQER